MLAAVLATGVVACKPDNSYRHYGPPVVDKDPSETDPKDTTGTNPKDTAVTPPVDTTHTDPPVEEKGVPFRLASYNIRYDSSDDKGDLDWSTSRKTLVVKMVQDKNFDVCGFVEVTQTKMRNDLINLLTGYTFKYHGRTNGTTSGEAVGFAFKKDKFTLESEGYFFLNEHPSRAGEATEWYDPVPSTPYNRSRIAAWGLLKDKESGKRFLYIVSHFELNKGMRAGSANLIIEKAKELAPSGVPIFFCGDLNAKPSETTCIAKLKEYFTDSYEKANSDSKIATEGGITTFNDFNLNVNKNDTSKRIDYMFYRGDDIILRKYGVIYDTINGKLPSDHYPIYVDIELK